MPVYTLPNFNRLWSFWPIGSPGAGTPPAVVDVPAQPYIRSRAPLAVSTSSNDTPFKYPIILRLPLGVYTPLRGDICQDQLVGGETYFVQWVQNMHRGFPNEYIAAYILRSDPFGNVLTTQTLP